MSGILSIQVISAIDLVSKDEKSNSSFFAVLKFYGLEIGSTNLSESTEPVWHTMIQQPMDAFKCKQKEFNRPAILEHITVEVWEQRISYSPEFYAEVYI
jgi:hypothetical protein